MSEKTGFGEAVKTCFRKYATFSGRASRAEYWWFFLFIVIGSIIAAFVDGLVFGVEATDGSGVQLVSGVFSLATFLPLLAAGWRRMHDTGRPGWYLLIPAVVSAVLAFGLLLGVFGFAQLEKAGVDEDALRTAATGLAGSGVVIAGVVQLAVAALVIWWLSRPGQPRANQFGDVP